MADPNDRINFADWAVAGAPDATSSLHALKVQERWQASGSPYGPVEYIMDMYGDTREEAEAIVRNCRGGEE